MPDTTVYRLPAPCWWIDYSHEWEDPHYLTLADADRALGVAYAPGVVRQYDLSCWQVPCFTCGEQQHVDTLDPTHGCAWECGGVLLDPGFVPAPRDPAQDALFEAMPTDDVGLPGGLIVMTGGPSDE